MLERDFQRRLLSALRAHEALREAQIWKVGDRFNAGRPDIQIFRSSVTYYFELKVMPNKPTKLQEYYLWHLRPVAWLVTALDAKNYQISDSYDVYTFDQIVTEIVNRCLP
jgi:hypothetical protein